MVSIYQVTSYLIIMLSYTSSVPAPQTSDTSDTSLDDYYGDYDETTKDLTSTSGNNDGLIDLLDAANSLTQGFLTLFTQKVNFIHSLMSNQELRDQVGQTVSTGLNLTGEIARVAVPLVRNAASQVPRLLNTTRVAVETLNSEENRDRVRDIAGAGSQVVRRVGVVASQTPELLGQGSRLLGSVIKAANDTAPLILDGIQEFTDQLPLITGFASAYAEVNAEQAQKVAQTFYTSLQCDLQCRDLVDKDLKQECLVQFCTEKEEDAV